MKMGLLWFNGLLILALLLPGVGQTTAAISPTSPGVNAIPFSSPIAPGDSSLLFIENVGQFDAGARFQVRGGDRAVWLAGDALWVTLYARQPLTQGAALRLSFSGANPHPRLEPFNRLDTSLNYFIGNDPTRWRADAPVWGGVRYVDLYPGIDLELTGEGGQLVQRLVARDGRADLAAVRLRVEGADRITLDDARLRLTTAAGEYTLPLLEVAGRDPDALPRPMLAGDQVAAPFGAFQDAVAAPRASGLLYATFLGGSAYDWGNDIALDATGAAYITGYTASSNFPVTPGAFDTSNSSSDAFVVKLNATGSALSYATFLGGGGQDYAHGIALDATGAAYISGETASTNFPTTAGAFDITFNGGADAFVAKLSPTGSALSYATYLGGSAGDRGFRIALDAGNVAYVTGQTISPDFPVTSGAYDQTYGGYGSYDVFVAKLNAAGSDLVYATYLGGTADDWGEEIGPGIAVDAGGAAYVVAYTTSPDFPTTPGAFDVSPHGYDDAFVVKLNAAGSALLYATFLGSNGYDRGYDVAVDASGAAYVTGWTDSYGFPTTPGAFSTDNHGGGDVFVTKLTPDGAALSYSTFLGGVSSNEEGYSIALDASNAAYVTGQTAASDFPVTADALDPDFNGNVDAFVAQFSPDGAELIYATYLGGSDYDSGRGIALDASGKVYLTGWVESSDFPVTPGALDPSLGGTYDAFAAKLALTGLATYQVSGHIRDDHGAPLPGVVVTNGSRSATADAGGAYTLTGLITGTYTLTPTLSGWSFTPVTRAVSVPPSATGQDFTAVPVVPVLSLTVSPAAVPADGATPALVTLANAPAGHQVRLLSSRGSLDTFTPLAGIISADGQFSATLRSAAPGGAILTAQDLTAGQTLPVSAQVTFTGGAGVLPPQTGDLLITGVDGDCGRLDCPVDGFFMLGLAGLDLPLRVAVDWGGLPPGTVAFTLNDHTDTVAATGSSVRYTLDINAALREGPNVLRIVARSGDQASTPVDLHLTGYHLPQWIMEGVNALPTLGNQALILEVAFPGQPLSDDTPIDWGFPGEFNQFQWQTTLKLTLPTRGGAFEVEVSRQTGHTSGNQPRAFLTLLGHPFDLAYHGQLSGVLQPDPPGVVVQELDIGAAIFTKVELDLGLVAALNALPPFGPVVGQALGVYPPLSDWLNDRAKLYIKITPTLSGDFTLAFQPQFHVAGVQTQVDFPLELGAQADLWLIEGHVYGGLGGRGTFGYSAEDMRIATLQAYGFGGYEFRLAGWLLQDRGDWQLAEYPPESGRLALMFVAPHATPEWQLIGHNTSKDYALFQAQPPRFQAFHHTSLTTQTTVTSVLVSNVYTYPEPALAVDPVTGDALLLWVHDDVAKPVGQGQELAFSLWNGATWSAPARVTDDTLIDGAPQVAWANDGQAVAIWQRFDVTLPLTATWNVTTAQQIEIATAVYSPTTGTWSPVTLLTQNAALDMLPQLARNPSGQLLAVWRQNAAGLLGGTEADPDRILYARYDHGWNAPAVAVEALPGLSELAVGYGTNSATIAYTRYLTATDYTTPTSYLFTSTSWGGGAWGAPTLRAGGGVGNRSPQIAYNSSGESLLVWIAGNNKLRLSNLTTGYLTVLPLDDSDAIDEFRLTQTPGDNLAAIFTLQTDQRDLYMAMCEGAHHTSGGWGKPQALTHDPAGEVYPAVAVDNAGRLLMSYAARAMTSVTRTATISGTSEVVTYTLPTAGPTDLMTLSHDFARNLTLETLAVSTEHPAPGAQVTLSATVRNTGDWMVEVITVGFYDGDPLHGGALIQTSAWAFQLVPGMATTLTAPYTAPTTGGARQLYAVVDPANSVAESDEADNTATLAAFGPDLELADAVVEDWGGSEVGLVTLIRNLGTSAAPTTTLAFYRDALTGTLAVATTVPPLAAGQSITLTTPWNFGPLSAGVYTLAAVANQGGFTETLLANNVYTLTLDVRPDLLVSPYYLWTTSPTGATVFVTATVYNVGAMPATNVTVGFYGDERLDERAPLFTRTISLLEPAHAATVSGEIRGPLACTLYAYVDPARAIDETTRANNLTGIAYCGLCHRLYVPLVLRWP